MIPPIVYAGILILSAMFLFAVAAWAAWLDREQPNPAGDPLAEAWTVATSIFEESEEQDGSTMSLIV